MPLQTQCPKCNALVYVDLRDGGMMRVDSGCVSCLNTLNIILATINVFPLRAAN